MAAVALGAVIIGLAPIGLRLSELGPQATAVWRFALALPALALLAMRSPDGLAAPPNLRTVLVIAGLSFGLDMAFYHAALKQTLVANATLLSNMTPIFAALAGWLLLRERLGWRAAAGMGVGIGGAAVLAFAREGAGTGSASGDLLATISAIWYAGYLVAMRFARRDVSVTTAMLWTTASAIAIVLPAALAFQEPLLPQTLNGWLVLAGLGLVVQVCGQGLIAYGLGQLPIALSTVLLWLQPVVVAVLGWAMFGEAIAPLGFAGAALLLAGVFIVQTAVRSQR